LDLALLNGRELPAVYLQNDGRIAACRSQASSSKDKLRSFIMRRTLPAALRRRWSAPSATLPPLRFG
jgi:hypothetical protein